MSSFLILLLFLLERRREREREKMGILEGLGGRDTQVVDICEQPVQRVMKRVRSSNGEGHCLLVNRIDPLAAAGLFLQ